jgi:hypothetical protein
MRTNGPKVVGGLGFYLLSSKAGLLGGVKLGLSPPNGLSQWLPKCGKSYTCIFDKVPVSSVKGHIALVTSLEVHAQPW